MTDTPNGRPAGWYADPHDASRELYWNGTRWTDYARDVPVSPTHSGRVERTPESPHVEDPDATLARQPSVRSSDSAPTRLPGGDPTGSGSFAQGSPDWSEAVDRPATVVPPSPASVSSGAASEPVPTSGSTMPPWRIGAFIVAGWGVISCLRVVTADGSFDDVPFYGFRSKSIFDLFTSPWGAPGLFGYWWSWFYDIVGTGLLGDSGLLAALSSPLFLLTLATTIGAIISLVENPRALLARQVAGILALGHVAVFVVLYLPIGEFGSFGSFISALILASLLPGIGGALMLSGVPRREKPPAPVGQAGQHFAPSVLPTGAPIEAVANGPRFGAYLLEGLLALITLFIGYLVWSLIVWGRGQTPGKQLLGLVVIDERTRAPATWGTMFVREFVGKGILGTLTFGITGIVSAFMILLGDERRGVWDHVANTTVVTSEVTRSG